MNTVRVGLWIAIGAVEAVWFVAVLCGAAVTPATPARRRRTIAAVWTLVSLGFVFHLLRMAAQLPRGVQLVAVAGISLGVIGSGLLFKGPAADGAA